MMLDIFPRLTELGSDFSKAVALEKMQPQGLALVPSELCQTFVENLILQTSLGLTFRVEWSSLGPPVLRPSCPGQPAGRNNAMLDNGGARFHVDVRSERSRSVPLLWQDQSLAVNKQKNILHQVIGFRASCNTRYAMDRTVRAWRRNRIASASLFPSPS
jgi:hypothetical protein